MRPVKGLKRDTNAPAQPNPNRASEGKGKYAPPRRQRMKTESKPPEPNLTCGQGRKDGSVSSVSIQHLEFPKNFEQKPFIRVPAASLANIAESPQSTSIIKLKGLGASNSINSHFDGMIFPVPNKYKGKCTSTSITERTESSVSSTKQFENQEDINSQEMIDSFHDASPKQMNLNGPEWRTPCQESFVAGAPRAYIGTCPHNYEKISKMSKARQKFFLTQDPRKKYCLRNPETLRKKAYSKKKEFEVLTKMVKHAENVCEGTASQSSESFICDVIDVENPMKLDFQGMDYQNTYQRDEQDLQNQRLYQRICRYLDRKRVRAETEVFVEHQLQQERLAIPQCFDVENRNEEVKSTTTEESVRHGKLYRTLDKPRNKDRTIMEHQTRQERYKGLYLSRKEKAEKERQQEEERKKEADEQHATNIALKNFEDAINNIDDVIQTSFNIERKLKRIEVQRRTFPHTLRETIQFKRNLKKANRIKCDEAKIKQEFYKDRFNKIKHYPEADFEFSTDTPRHSNEGTYSEQSSDDEDALEVGKKQDVFKLRGFHYKLGDNIRGKRHQCELFQGTRKEKGCKTREQWLAELAPKKEQIKLDIEEGIQKFKSPDDPELVLFLPEFGFKAPKAKSSAVRQYIEKRLGRHYERILRKNLKLVKPRLRYSVKKFNLISYLYGDADKRLSEMKAEKTKQALEHVKNEHTTLDYIEAKQRFKKRQLEVVKQKRLELLGIPWREIKKSRLQTLCENSESESNSDWVPEYDKNPDALPEESYHMKLSVRQRGNMPAPKYREMTLRRNPRKPRDYINDRVPSELFDETVKKTGLPHMHKLPPNKFTYTNVRLKRTPYTDLFDARHHHDHWDATQVKLVDVHYESNIVPPEMTKIKTKEKDIIMENFKMADPPCNAFVEMDLTMPKCDTDAMIAEHMQKKNRKIAKTAQEQIKNICVPRDFVYHSRPPEELVGLDYPGRQEYLDLLNEVRNTLRDTKEVEVGPETLTVDKDALVKELEEDLKSIESCLTSLSSSQCTNFTNDSGSYLLMEGKTKVPLDYIRKSVVPFEELQRSRFKLVPIDVDAEDANPFKVLPFPGQKKAQLELTTPKDSFFTFNTRLQNGLRMRLEVPVEDVREKLLGAGANKYPGAVTTDIDENYVDELKNRPPVKMFNFQTGRSFVKDALRLKFETMLIQGQIVRTKIYDRLNEQHWENMQRTKLLYEKLFSKWEKREYEAAMNVVHQVKSYYEKTDELKREFRELEREQLILNMDIVFIEGHWIRRIMLQNFHYLLADQDWRIENDWIHRVEGSETELESFEESIAKRNIVNIRQREKDDAWAIKTFYEDVYLKNQHPILIVFPDADSFIKGIENLKVKTFVLLLELHYTLSIHTELQNRLETFEEWCMRDLKDKEEYVSRKCSKLYFMDNRAAELKRRTLDFLDIPIEVSFNDESFNRDRAVITEVWRQIVPANIRGSNDKDIDPIDMVAMMSDVVVELIGKFESIPAEKSKKIEIALRRRRAHERKLSYQAYQVERRIEMEMKKVRKNLEPPYQKPKRVGKLPRVYIKKKQQLCTVKEKRVSEHTKFFFRAFHDDGDTTQLGDARDSLYVADTIQEQIVPFYFDYFLKLNGYTPNYNFKTVIEMRDGLEMDRFKVQVLLPEIQEKITRWELVRKKIMEENISRNPKMYENVNF